MWCGVPVRGEGRMIGSTEHGTPEQALRTSRSMKYEGRGLKNFPHGDPHVVWTCSILVAADSDSTGPVSQGQVRPPPPCVGGQSANQSANAKGHSLTIIRCVAPAVGGLQD